MTKAPVLDLGGRLMPIPSDLFGLLLIGPTLIHRGTPEQKKRFS